ncbi:MAG: DivIVA domain-containing protein [Actinomycetota bacterium]|nr:DivIVA domain-containing protein [Actinomycetota bacterium]
MPVLPDEVAAKTFARRLWRGYDRSQVDVFLRQVAADYAGAIDRIATIAEDRTAARSRMEDLLSQLSTAVESAQQTADKARRDADTDAEAIRARAEHTATLITAQAEDAATALTRQTQALREVAQADADAARERLADADRRAQQLEDTARERWEALRVETEQRFDRLQAAERRFAERTQHAHAALGALRSQVALLDHVQQAEAQLAALHTDTAPPYPDPTGDPNGARPSTADPG